MFNDDLDYLRRALADGVQQRFLDAGEADLLHQQLDKFHRFTVDGQVQCAAAHVVDAVRIQRRAAVFERLAYDRNVAESGGIQEDPLLVGELSRRANTSCLSLAQVTDRCADVRHFGKKERRQLFANERLANKTVVSAACLCLKLADVLQPWNYN
jgi:hypothetical protein